MKSCVCPWAESRRCGIPKSYRRVSVRPFVKISFARIISTPTHDFKSRSAGIDLRQRVKFYILSLDGRGLRSRVKCPSVLHAFCL